MTCPSIRLVDVAVLLGPVPLRPAPHYIFRAGEVDKVQLAFPEHLLALQHGFLDVDGEDSVGLTTLGVHERLRGLSLVASVLEDGVHLILVMN